MSRSGYAGGRPGDGAGNTSRFCPNLKATARQSAARRTRATTALLRHFTLLHRDASELALPHFQEVHARRKPEVRIRDPPALDAHSALGDQPPRLRPRRRKAELRE